MGSVAINGTNIASPVLKGAVTGSIGGGVGGYAGGFTSGLITTGDIGQAHQMGMGGLTSGLALGGVAGGVSGYAYAKANGIGPWSGRLNENTVMIGGPQIKVDKFALDLKSETITKSDRFDIWPDDLKAYLGRDIVNPKAIEFNQNWINNVIDSNTPIYNINRNGYSPFYHGIEMSTIFSRGYQNVIPVRAQGYFNNRLRFTIW